ncbi:MAG: DUF3179 domain-containing protein [Phycisphaeraceae bacterium]
MQQKILIGLGATLACLLLIVSVVRNWDLVQSRDSGSNRAVGVGSGNRAGASASFLDQFNIDNLTIPRDEILRGGPPKDAIPAITDPDVTSVADAEFLRLDDRVVGITIEGETRAYPIRLLNWHEAVNDRLGDTPFAVIYCPLCDSASVVDRRIDGEVLEFGISGLLYNSNVLLYDRTHEALWSQIGFEAVSGPYAGRSLEHLPWELTTFERWRQKHADSTVATFNTGHRRDYTRNPYEQYFQQDGLMFPAKGGDDDRLPPKEPVVGVQVGGFARAYPIDRVASAPDGRVEDHLDQARIVLEAGPDDQHIRVIETPEGARVVHTFWFAWVAFHPETTVFEQED